MTNARSKDVVGSASAFTGFWGTSWSALQGIASDFLGNDGDVQQRQQKALGRLQNDRSVSRNRKGTQWGPGPASALQPANSSLGTGTREEREAALRAQKRKDMLTRQESSYADALGKFKRRLSDDHESSSAPPAESDGRAALVYLHHVSKSDTLAGLTIKYNCSAVTLRKANRMWPNDTIQSRTTIVLPVDACGVKGKPVSGDSVISESDALSAGQAEEVEAIPRASMADESGTRHRALSISSAATMERRASSSDTAGEPPWHHDSWVLLPNATDPTEIARLSRRTLGYFPPARRKSNCFSESNTPSTSLDLVRNQSTQTNPAISPRRSDSRQRPRRLSNATSGYFPSYLSGPGGVGTMNRNVHFPGPAQDGLNKMFARHLPDVAPPKNQVDLYQPGMPMYSDEGSSGFQTPHYPNGRSNGVNLENVGGAIESWVRRMAKKPDQPTRAARASVGAPGKGAGGIGDLIEMTDEFEIGRDDEDDDEPFRGRQGSVATVERVSAGSGSEFPSNAARDRRQDISKSAWKSGKVD